MKINRNKTNKTLYLSQKKYMNGLLIKFKIINDKFTYSSIVQRIQFVSRVQDIDNQ